MLMTITLWTVITICVTIVTIYAIDAWVKTRKGK